MLFSFTCEAMDITDVGTHYIASTNVSHGLVVYISYVEVKLCQCMMHVLFDLVVNMLEYHTNLTLPGMLLYLSISAIPITGILPFIY